MVDILAGSIISLSTQSVTPGPRDLDQPTARTSHRSAAPDPVTTSPYTCVDDVTTLTWGLDVEERSIGAIGLSKDPNILLLATSRGFERLTLSTGQRRVVAEVDNHDADMRMNDGTVSPEGDFWAGTMHVSGLLGAGTLYRLTGDKTSTVLASVAISNGMGWSPDHASFYYIDSPTRTVRVFPYEPYVGVTGTGRVLVDTTSWPGTPDGMCVDSEGCLWVCFYGGSAIRRFSPNGALVTETPLPVSAPTSCCFGGPHLDELLITTSTYGLSPQELLNQDLAGSVLALRPGTTGLPPRLALVSRVVSDFMVRS